MPDDVTGSELDRDARRELSSLSKDAATYVSRHLVMAGRLLDEDPEAAWQHAVAARGRAARIAVAREAVGLAAYRTGRFAEAAAELRTARRLTGSPEHLPLIADAERGLGRPERALALAVSDEARELDTEGRIEMLLVAAGARADLGQHEAAVVTLQVPQLRSPVREQWLARLRSAYADALAAVGRDDEARTWLELAAEVDETGETGAADRLAEMDGVLLFDDEELDGEDDGTGPAPLEVPSDAAVDLFVDEENVDEEKVEPSAELPAPEEAAAPEDGVRAQSASEDVPVQEPPVQDMPVDGPAVRSDEAARRGSQIPTFLDGTAAGPTS